MENFQLKLIDNTYSNSEAFELLTALINDKIRFLKQKVFSIQERSADDTSHLEKRIAELQEDKEKLIQKFQELEGKEFNVDIDCKALLKIYEAQIVYA